MHYAHLQDQNVHKKLYNVLKEVSHALLPFPNTLQSLPITFERRRIAIHKGPLSSLLTITFYSLAFEYFQGDDQTDKVGLQFEQLRLSSVEREFRKRIAEYHSGNGINGNGDSGSVSILIIIGHYIFWEETNFTPFIIVLTCY